MLESIEIEAKKLSKAIQIMKLYKLDTNTVQA